MPKEEDISIRPMEIRDFRFIRDVAARQPNFTIPPPYVLWLLLKIKGDICLVAEGPEKERLAYLLAVRVNEPVGALYVWQLASDEKPASSRGIYLLVLALRGFASHEQITSIFFSAIPKSATMRTLRRYIREVFETEPVETQLLHEFVAPGESEFRIDLK